MGNGSTKPGDAVADAARDRFGRLRRERERARRRLESVPDWAELSEVTRPGRHPSTPAPVRGLVAVLTLLPPWGRVLVVLALIVAAAAGGRSLGWW